MARKAVMAIAGLVAAALVGCGSTSSGNPPATNSPAVTSPLQALTLTASEVSAADPHQTVTAMPAEQSTTLGVGGTTLDACGVAYPSEALRTQRLQIVYDDNNKRQTASNEVVRYQSAAAATQAYHELTSAVASCTRPWAMSDMQREPADPQLADQQVIISGQIPQSIANGAPIFACYIYQFRGDLLSAVYAYRLTRDQAVFVAKALAPLALGKLTAQS